MKPSFFYAISEIFITINGIDKLKFLQTSHICKKSIKNQKTQIKI